jgi:hypothetical protein
LRKVTDQLKVHFVFLAVFRLTGRSTRTRHKAARRLAKALGRPSREGQEEGMGSVSKRASGWLVPAALGSAALTAAIVAHIRPASAFGRDGLQQIHERITRNAFPFMTGASSIRSSRATSTRTRAPRLTWPNVTRRTADLRCTAGRSCCRQGSR